MRRNADRMMPPPCPDAIGPASEGGTFQATQPLFQLAAAEKRPAGQNRGSQRKMDPNSGSKKKTRMLKWEDSATRRPVV